MNGYNKKQDLYQNNKKTENVVHLKQPAHKTALQNHTRHPWFAPSSSTGKERDRETGYGYFGARYMDYELMTMWLSVDPMADKYPSISPYAYCAWNPVKLVDPDGREIDISALYDKNGKCKYKFIENALKAFAKTKLGYKELSKYAKAGQDILGVKFDKDGEYHSKGMDLSFGGEVASLQNSGDTERKKVNGRLNITINLSNVTDIKSIFETICHETFIHARQAAADFKDNGELDHSYLNPYLKKYVKEAGGDCWGLYQRRTLSFCMV